VRAPTSRLVPLLGLAILLLSAPAAARAGGGDDDGDDPSGEGWDAFDAPRRGPEPKRLSLQVFGGELTTLSGSAVPSATVYGGEVAWRFDGIELGLLGQNARLRTSTRDWSPVALVRITERFQSRRGLEGSITFGLGAAREDRWRSWFQVALGARLNLGPIFVGGEVGFEQADYIRLVGALGTRF
jgi:hypothetical protein